MICNAENKLNIMRDAVRSELRSLKSQDQNDPNTEMQLANNRRVHNVLQGKDADAIERELYWMSQDVKDPLTNNFKTALTGSDNKVTIYLNGNKRREEVKSVNYIKGATQDYIEVATYPTTKPNVVRNYVFAVGQDIGNYKQGGSNNKKAEIVGLGEYTSYLQNSGAFLEKSEVDRTKNKEARDKAMEEIRDLLGSSEEARKHFNGTEKKVDDYVHGNVNHMKNMFNQLGAKGKYGEHGRKLLDSFSRKFFKDMELFLGEVEKSGAEGKAGVEFLAVYKSKLPRSDRSSMSAAEVYLHEVIHTMTRFALDSKTDKSEALYKQLDALVSEAAKSIKAEDLYPEGATQTEKYIIDERYDYIFNHEDGPRIGNQEFLAFALTNEPLMEKLKEIGVKEEKLPLMDRIVDFFNKLVRVLLGELDFKVKDKSLYERAYNLAYRLGEININHEEKRSKLVSASDSVVDMINTVDAEIADRIQLVRDKVAGDGLLLDKYPVNGSKAEKTKYMLKFIKFGMTTEEGRGILRLMFTSIGVNPTGSLIEFVGSFFERSDVEKVADWLGLAAGKIDTMRESIVNSSRGVILEAFDGELKEFEDEALTKYLIDTNFGVIYKEHGIDGVKKFIGSNSEVEKELKRLKRELGKLDKDNYNWLSTQAHGLGYYMATHRTNIAQNANSYNIARGLMGDSKIAYNPEVEKIVSEIAALTSLSYIKDTDAEVILDLIERKEEGVTTVINMYEGFKTETRKTMFKDDPVHMVEGYSSEQFNDNIELKVLPEREAAKLKSLGFKKVKDLGRKNKDGQSLSLYVSEGYGVRERLRGAAKLVSMSAKGTSLAETIFGYSLNPELELSVETKILNKRRKEIAQQMANGTFDPSTVEDTMMPLLNGDGKVISYRYVMDKKSKKEFLEQDTKVTEVLPRSKGHLVDKIFTLEQNENVLNFIKEDMEANFKGRLVGGPKGLTDYIIINEDSPNEEYRELFKMLPKSFKDYANSRDDKSIAIPASLYHPIFGYQHISIVNNKVAKKMPEFVVKIAGMVEELWMDLVKIVKGNTLMKTPIVLIGNIISNFVFRVVNGAEPIKLMGDYYRSFKDARQFTRNNREILKLQNEVDIAKEEVKTNPNSKLSAEIKRKESAIRRLKSANKDNPINELVEAGLYQSIVEDVEVSTLEGKTVWDKMGNSVLGKLPSGIRGKVKTGADIIYLNQRTKWFKVNQEIMQISDLVARDVQNRTAKVMEKKQARGDTQLPAWWLNEKGWDKKRKLSTKEERAEFLERSKEVRMYALLENYVNYSRPSGRGEEYLNRMGILMFTKYAKRIQKVVMDQGTNYPLKTFLAVLINTHVMDTSTIQDAHILSKDWHTESHGPGNFYPIYSPLDLIENAVTPSLFKSTTWDFLPI